MERESIELHPLLGSSLIARWGWQPHPVDGREEGILALEFHEGGVWHYLAIPLAVFENFVLAGSKGRFFLEAIKGKFQAMRVDEPVT